MMKGVPHQIEPYVKAVDDFMSKYPVVTQEEQFRKIQDKTGYPKAYFFVVAVALLGGFVTLLGGSKLVVDLLGFLYPAYMSFKSMDAGSEDDTQWLTYWVVFSFLSILESMIGFVLQLIPFYFWLKIGVIVWLLHPSTRGAQTVYEQALRPLLLPYLETKSSKKAE